MHSACSTEAGPSASTSFQSCARGNHEYYRSWTPVSGELFLFKREISNDHDPFAVAIWKDGEVVGQVPMSLSKITSYFLNYDSKVVFCEFTGRNVNRGVGLGIEVPCVCKFYGCPSYINKLNELLRSK